jgi:hypothetical protein
LNLEEGSAITCSDMPRSKQTTMQTEREEPNKKSP